MNFADITFPFHQIFLQTFHLFLFILPGVLLCPKLFNNLVQSGDFIPEGDDFFFFLKI